MKMAPLTQYLTYQLYNAIQLSSKLSDESDIEHLHQFRVSIRRSRSLLKLYAPQYYAVQEVMREIVRQTNPLRELDVFIASIDPDAYPKLITLLHAYRKEQFDAIMTDAFRIDAAATLRKLYDAICELNPDIDAATLVETAELHFSTCLDAYRSVTKKSSDEELHKLRIRFKIARYALEFLSHSGLHNELEKIRECKAVQDHLGALQDASNQFELLRGFCETHANQECHILLHERKRELKRLKKLTVASR